MEKIRGSIDIPLNPKGRRHALDLARCFARAYRNPGHIFTSKLERAVETAQIISDETGWPIKEKSDALEPWHLGALEGVDVKVADPILTFLAKHPDLSAPGRAKNGTKSGESFNSFRERFLKKMRLLIAGVHDNHIHVVVTHHRNIVTLQAWLKAGRPSDLEFRKVNVTDSGESPGAVFKLNDNSLTEIDPSTYKPGPGLYIVRHGDTEYNG